MATKQNRPTLRTIADLSGLAVPTVSRALNDAPDIGKETKKRVREIADRIGCLLYTSPSPRDLSTSRMPSSA